MGLTLTSVLPDYKASLSDAASLFRGTDLDADADFKRHLNVAKVALSREKRQRTCLGEITVTADVAEYAAPDAVLMPKLQAWTTSNRQPWDTPNEPAPVVRLIEVDGVRKLSLSPAPSVRQIACFGATFRYYYLAAHQLTDDSATSTLAESDQPLLVLRAQVEAMRELAFRNYAKPVTLRAGAGAAGSMMTRNQTPAALYDLLLDEYRNSP